ncbi:pyrroline-5-carboxylate reductase [Clathrospora elynae]|uniref:Proline dehydrogenase n=1 Tax=Clathrospora elynae TaxID=706981 RepID=A0A6A5SSR1_9PLEO|nr:pyrroline-5-carboxylate reductase [Clathrospora elynae]
MPTNMLLRSLFIATVSSNKFLLIPSLHLLSFFSKPNRGFLFNVDRNPVLKAILKRTLYNQFCAGETEQETRACVKQLKDLGFKGVILTYAKEMVFDHKADATNHHTSEKSVDSKAVVADDIDIEAWRAGTLRTVDLISEASCSRHHRTTGGGPAVSHAFSRGELPPQQMLDALDEIAVKCKERGIQIIVDAESHHWQQGIARTTLELMRKFNRDGKAVIYNTYQAYLKGTPAVLAHHMAETEKSGFTLGLKLVRGAYMLSDDRSLIHDTKEDTDNAYNGIAQGALRQQIGDFGASGSSSRPFPPVNLFLASHNRDSVLSANKLHRQRLDAGLPTVPVAFGQLHGMSDEVSFSLLADKGENEVPPEVLKCTTWGSMGECVGYLLRRAVENRDAVDSQANKFSKFIACVHSENSSKRLSHLLHEHTESGKLVITRGDNVEAVQNAYVVILAVDPSQVEATLKQDVLAQALKGKLLISVAAGWSRENLERLLVDANAPEKDEERRIWILHTLPNILAQVSQSLTAIEDPTPAFPPKYLEIADAIFSQIGKTMRITPRLMPATTVTQIYQSMRGTVEMLQSGVHPGGLKDQGISAEGCTIGGVMLMEEMGMRGTQYHATHHQTIAVAKRTSRQQ